MATALENYLNGCGMVQSDEDEPVLEGILNELEANQIGTPDPMDI